MKNRTTVERKSDRELLVTRVFDGPPHIVFQAWTKPDLFKRWWIPKSLGLSLLSYEADIRTGGTYRLVFKAEPQPMAFYGKYIEVTPHSRLAWTNEEGGAAAVVTTTVTFEEKGGKTLLVVHELHPSKEAREEAFTAGGWVLDAEGNLEAFGQLDELLVTLGAS